MSKGFYSDAQCGLAHQLFGWGMCLKPGEFGARQAKDAREIDPLHDKQLSELCWDMLCLIESIDEYSCGTINADAYMEDVKRFKAKWLKPKGEELAKAEIDKSIEELRHELNRVLCPGEAPWLW